MKHISAERRLKNGMQSERLARGLVSLPSWMQAAREKTPSERTSARRQIIGSGQRMHVRRARGQHQRTRVPPR